MERLETLNGMGWAIELRLRPPGIGRERYAITATRFDGEALAFYSATGPTLEIAERRLLAAMNVGAGIQAQVTEVLRVSA